MKEPLLCHSMDDYIATVVIEVSYHYTTVYTVLLVILYMRYYYTLAKLIWWRVRLCEMRSYT